MAGIQTEDDGGLVRPPLVAAPPGALYPLSANQEQMLVTFDLDHTSAVYNMPPHVQHFEEMIDTKALRRCLEALVDRHPTLRTHVLTDSDTGEAMQHVVPMPSHQVVLEVLTEAEQTPGATNWLNMVAVFVSRLCEAPFDVYAGPWARFGVVQHGNRVVQGAIEGGSTIVLGMHQMAGDGRSHGLLVQELASLYAVAMETPDSVSCVKLCKLAGLEPLEVQYVDFAYWQRQWLSVVSKSQLAYWRVQLGVGGPAPLDIPTDRPRPMLQTFSGASVKVMLHEQIVTGLGRVQRQTGSTLYMVISSQGSSGRGFRGGHLNHHGLFVHNFSLH
jgi:hypothetical protein